MVKNTKKINWKIYFIIIPINVFIYIIFILTDIIFYKINKTSYNVNNLQLLSFMIVSLITHIYMCIVYGLVLNKNGNNIK